MLWLVNIKKYIFWIVAIYHSPSAFHADFLYFYKNVCEELNNAYNIIILDDLNTDMFKMGSCTSAIE